MKSFVNEYNEALNRFGVHDFCIESTTKEALSAWMGYPFVESILGCFPAKESRLSNDDKLQNFLTLFSPEQVKIKTQTLELVDYICVGSCSVGSLLIMGIDNFRKGYCRWLSSTYDNQRNSMFESYSSPLLERPWDVIEKMSDPKYSYKEYDNFDHSAMFEASMRAVDRLVIGRYTNEEVDAAIKKFRKLYDEHPRSKWQDRP